MKLKRIVLSLAMFFALIPMASAASKPVSDDFLIDTIRQKLAADQVVKGGAIEVVVKNGAVTLSGTVEEDKQKNKAEKIAKKVSGVKSVTNEIKIAHP
ncbi:MAG TPA: BON domain-containing protein [Bryobacteraceae bacterium]|jgi:osmotically-inducible protein OsmY|nr:BON domain-containing protein [Bryobacteraceae bacterium]